MDAVIYILEALVVLGAIIMGTRSGGVGIGSWGGIAPVEAGSGRSIPLVRTLQWVAQQADFILCGPEDVAAAPSMPPTKLPTPPTWNDSS
jgi:hypothetical protein